MLIHSSYGNVDGYTITDSSTYVKFGNVDFKLENFLVYTRINLCVSVERLQIAICVIIVKIVGQRLYMRT